MAAARDAKQKRAPNDARTAWRNMHPEDRATFLSWAAGTDDKIGCKEEARGSFFTQTRFEYWERIPQVKK